MTTETLPAVPNQPKTKVRGIRVPDDLWAEAQRVAAERGEDVSSVARAALVRYVKRGSR